MKAPDPCERWMLRSGELIIERLLAISARTISPKPIGLDPREPKPPRDRHYFAWRRCEAMRVARQELARLMTRG